MVSSKVYPGLDRSPKKNWVENSGGLPDYIERVAKHIHYEGGKSISQAISMAISQVKKWAVQGKAEAQKAIAQWEKLKASNKARQAVKLSAQRIAGSAIELSIVEDKTGRTPPKAPWEKKTVSYGSGPSQKARATAQKKGQAFKNGRFPIRNVADLKKAKQAVGRAKPGDRAALIAFINRRAKELGQPPLGKTDLARGPYKRHVEHTKQFGRAKGNLAKPASWQHPYQPVNQVAGALKAKHISKGELDSKGNPKPGSEAKARKPLPPSATVTGLQTQHDAPAQKSTPAKKASAEAPAYTALLAKRRALRAKVKAGTATPAERKALNQVVAKLKTTKRAAG